MEFALRIELKIRIWQIAQVDTLLKSDDRVETSVFVV